MLQQALNNIGTDLETFKKLVDELETASIHEQYSNCDAIIQSMLVSLDSDICPLDVTLRLIKLWRQLASLIQGKIFEKTLQIWLNSPRAATQDRVEINHSVLLNETPTLMFRVDDRIFRSPPHFEVLIGILNFYLVVVKNYNEERLSKSELSNPSENNLEEKKSLVRGYTGAQHLAIVQFLLDICDGDETLEPNLEEIRDIACAQIHHMFVSDPGLPKLVHYLTYSVNLIPMMVNKVPSMQVLIGDIGELIVYSHLERRIFAVNLISELARKYTNPFALSAVEFVEDVLLTLLESTIDEDTIILFLNIVDALAQFMKFGPPHEDLVKYMLKRVKNVAQARSALYRSEAALFVSPEQHLISKIHAITHKSRC